MNTLDVSLKASSDPILGQIFVGTFPCNKIPSIYNFPSAIVVNLDTNKLPGSHWVALYFEKLGACEYFDSYGQKPSSEILLFISKNAKSYIYNNVCVQDLWSISCGQMCLYYLTWRCRGLSMKEIVKYMINDDFIKGFVDSL